MIIAYAILSHLLADFVFQPGKLVQWKQHSKWGVLFHVAVHFLILLLVFSPFLLVGDTWLIYFSLGICFFHFFIDMLKVWYDNNHSKKLTPFLVDQFAHLSTILGAMLVVQACGCELTFLGDSGVAGILMNIQVPIALIILVFSSYFLEVFRYTFNLDHQRKAKVSFNYFGFYLRAVVPTSAFVLLTSIF